ncbi:MAG: hypothetical protein OSA83_05570 [Pseudomonadales bacterium]|jgi:hypothetical protein|nr:hypothetical protein [Pseudomonadales bacterium]
MKKTDRPADPAQLEFPTNLRVEMDVQFDEVGDHCTLFGLNFVVN